MVTKFCKIQSASRLLFLQEQQNPAFVFVKMCLDPDVQRLTWESYMHKKLVRRSPMAHIRVFFKDVAHLLGLAPT